MDRDTGEGVGGKNRVAVGWLRQRERRETKGEEKRFDDGGRRKKNNVVCARSGRV